MLQTYQAHMRSTAHSACMQSAAAGLVSLHLPLTEQPPSHLLAARHSQHASHVHASHVHAPTSPKPYTQATDVPSLTPTSHTASSFSSAPPPLM